MKNIPTLVHRRNIDGEYYASRLPQGSRKVVETRSRKKEYETAVPHHKCQCSIVSNNDSITFWHKRKGRWRAWRVIRWERNASQSSFPKLKFLLKRPFKRRLCYGKLSCNTSNWALMLMAGRCESRISHFCTTSSLG